MSTSYNTTALLAEIRRRAAAPAASSTAPGWTDAECIARINGAIPTVTKRLRAVRAGYFLTQKDVAFSVGTASYRIPTRAMHGVVGLVQRLLATGDLASPLEKWTESDLSGRNPTQQGKPEAYLWRGNSAVFWPVPDSASESVRFTYHRRPNRVVAASAVATITAFGSTTITLSVGVSAVGFTTSTPLDFLRAALPFDSIADDQTPTGASGSVLSYSGGVPSGIAIGDYVCLAEQAPVLQLPPEAFWVVAQMVANLLLTEDPAALAKGERDLLSLEEDLYGGASDRDDVAADSVAQNAWA